jgi:6-phosphogluconolactonase
VLVSNRGVASDTIALFRFDADKGTFDLVELAPTQGREPRELIFSPDGRFVIVASQDSDALAVLAFDEDGPGLRFLSSTPVPTPVCLRIA